MNKANDILTEITNKLKAINGVSVLDGYLVHYANDLMEAGGDNSFPCVAVQLESETVEGDNSKKLKLRRTYKLIGAIDAIDPTMVNERLNNLLNSVRVALYSNAYEPTTSLASNITMTSTDFKLPDSSDIYALFETSLVVTYVEILS